MLGLTSILISIAIVGTLSFTILNLQMVEAQTTLSLNKPDGIVRSYDDRIYIVQHSGYSKLEGVEGRFGTDSIIYGDIVNLSDDTVYYIIMRGNVYKDEQLWGKTGYQQEFTFRYDYPWEAGNPTELAISPFKLTLRPGEASPFVLWPGQTGWDCYKVWVESYEMENKAEDINDKRMRNDIVVQNLELEKSGTYRGKIFNPTENQLEYTYVILVKYNTNNEIFAILGDDVGPLSPNTSKSFSIAAFLTGYPIKTHTDNFLYGEPARVEVLAWGYSPYEASGDYEDYDEKHPVQFMAESMYYPNESLPQYMDLEEIREKAKQVSQKPINKNFCMGGEETALLSEQNGQVSQEEESKVLTAKTRIPNWVRDTAMWWAEGRIGDSDFVSGIQYLIKQRIMQIPPTEISESADESKNKSVTEHGYIEVDGREFFVSRYDPATVIVSGNVEDYSSGGNFVECDFTKPDEYYDELVTFPIVNEDDGFRHTMAFTSDFKLGEYHLDCEYKNKDIGSVSFSLLQSSEQKPIKKTPTENTIPEWIKNNADWWSQGLITDDDFVKGIQYLVEQGIIEV